MKRPLEFWATVAIALVVVYMIHDAYATKPHTTQVHIEDIEVEDPKDTAFEPAGVYTEWQSSITARSDTTDWPCLEELGC